jgi:hypothetical protein
MPRLGHTEQHAGADANAVSWTDIALATLCFARDSADVAQWRRDNGRYLARLQEAYLTQYQRIQDAIEALKMPAPSGVKERV